MYLLIVVVAILSGVVQYGLLRWIERLFHPRKTRYAYAFSIGGVGGGLGATFIATVWGDDVAFFAIDPVVLIVTVAFVLHGAMVVIPKEET